MPPFALARRAQWQAPWKRQHLGGLRGGSSCSPTTRTSSSIGSTSSAGSRFGVDGSPLRLKSGSIARCGIQKQFDAAIPLLGSARVVGERQILRAEGAGLDFYGETADRALLPEDFEQWGSGA